MRRTPIQRAAAYCRNLRRLTLVERALRDADAECAPGSRHLARLARLYDRLNLRCFKLARPRQYKLPSMGRVDSFGNAFRDPS